jgi:hypothetical protein
LLQTSTLIVRVQRFSALKMQCAASMMQRSSQHCAVRTHDLPLRVALPTPVLQHIN